MMKKYIPAIAIGVLVSFILAIVYNAGKAQGMRETIDYLAPGINEICTAVDRLHARSFPDSNLAMAPELDWGTEAEAIDVDVNGITITDCNWEAVAVDIHDLEFVPDPNLAKGLEEFADAWAEAEITDCVIGRHGEFVSGDYDLYLEYTKANED